MRVGRFARRTNADDANLAHCPRRCILDRRRNRDVLGLDRFYVCYHDDADGCECRKPKPGLLLDAAAEHNLSLPDSYMIGDRWRDVDCGHAASSKTIFIDNGYSEPLRTQPEFRVLDLRSAVSVIYSQEGQS